MSTPEDEVAASLDSLRAAKPPSPAAAAAVASQLHEDSALFAGRGPQEVERLRGYMLAVLAELGPPTEALPFVVAELAQGYHPYGIAAAARAAGAMGPRARAAVRYMTSYLAPGFHDDQLSFAEYKPAWPLRHPTTARLEIVRALGRIGPAAVEAQPLLEHLAAADASSPELREEAKRSLRALQTPSCCEASVMRPAPAATLVDGWLRAGDRATSALDSTAVIDHDGRRFPLADLRGRPVAMSFFYTRCENPNKCSLTVARIGALQAALRRSCLEDQVELVLVSLDPVFDTPERLRRFAQARGMRLGDRAVALRMSDWNQFERFAQSVHAAANFSMGRVSVHGVDLMLLDREGRRARVYRNGAWDDGAVIADLRRLVRE
jgi:protein SCO1/2